MSILTVLLTGGSATTPGGGAGIGKGHGLLEILRFTIVCLIALLFNQPEWVEEYRPDEKPSIAVLYDQSGSMQTRDVVTGRTTGSPPITRAEAIAPLTSRGDVGQARREAPGRHPALLVDAAGCRLEPPRSARPGGGPGQEPARRRADFDGDWNEGPPPVQAASRLRMKNVPVFTVAAGSPRRLPDVELLNFDLPTFGIAGKAVRIPFTIDSSLPREYVTTVTLKASDGETITKDVRVAAMGRTNDWIAWKPNGTGDFTVSLEIPRHGEETIPDNNTLSAPIAIRQEKLKVLVVESYPRWEYRYLRNALSATPGVEVSCLLFHPGLSKVGGGNKDYIKQFPAGIEELSKFDVVFLGDVGLEDGQITEEQCRLLKGLVEHQAKRSRLHARLPGTAGEPPRFGAQATCCRSSSMPASRGAGARGPPATSS